MNKHVWYLGALLMSSITSYLVAENHNNLTKVFHHRGMVSDTVVCYLTKDPICNKLPHKVNEKEEKKQQEVLNLFLPMTVVHGADAKTMIKKLHAANKEHYSITLQEVQAPITGVKVMISYNPNKIVCDYQVFNAITGDKGVMFAFHNKEVLAKLKLSTDPLMQYACNIQDHKTRPRIMVDIGHGGSDAGKVGCFHVKEKAINLQVGTKVAALLTRAGFEVFLTRADDSFVPLDERTTQANKKRVDLFLSIHANASVNSYVSGVETYWFDSKLFKNNKLASHETVQKMLSIQDTLSCLFANSVHEAVLDAAKKVSVVTDRKVKTAISQVLLGTDLMIPTALIELGFLSNPQETKLLMDTKYQTTLAQGIVDGIQLFFKKCLA